MADFYQRMQNTATSLLTKFSQGSAQYVAITNSGTEWNPTRTETLHDVNLTANGTAEAYADDTVLASDLVVSMAVFDVEPDLNGALVIDGKRHQIIRVLPKPAAGTVAAWRLIVRA